jgi:hypothetical protein
MQAGNAAAAKWVLEYEPEAPKTADPLMGYTSTTDMRRQIRLEFDTQDQAVAYAERNGIPYRLHVPQEPTPKKISYADNFGFRRPQAWTH